MKQYTESHEWFEAVDGNPGLVKIGISAHAAQELGDVVFVDLPEVNRAFAKAESMAVIESVKAVGDLWAPFAGTVTQVNEQLNDEPALVTSSPEDEGWILLLQAERPEDVDNAGMTPDAYQALLAKKG